MSTFNTQILSTLTTRFPTSDALFAWLQTDEGGNLAIRTNSNGLSLVYSIKDAPVPRTKTSNFALAHVREFRSVVWDTHTNRPICVGPRSGRPLAEMGEVPCDVMDEFVDGVMINLFYYGGRWQLATHTVLGAANRFYGQRAFGTLFWETFTSMGLVVDDLNKSATYSWVLQHPEERVVSGTLGGIPRLWLIAHTDCELNGKFAILRPTQYTEATSLAAIEERVRAIGAKFGPNVKGLILKTNEDSFTIRTPEYLAAHALRGNQPKHAFTWLDHWSSGKLGAYMRIFPEEQAECTAILEQFKVCTQEFHDWYLKVYCHRGEAPIPLALAPQKYRKLLWEARQANTGSYFGNLRTFMNKQDTARKVWLIHYEARYGVPVPVSVPSA